MWLSRSKKQRFFVTLSSEIFPVLSALNRKPRTLASSAQKSLPKSHGAGGGASLRVNNLKSFEKEKDFSHLERNVYHIPVA